MRYIILRDDDTCAVTPRFCLERLYRPFLDRGLPVNLAVIPEVRSDIRTPGGKREGFLSVGIKSDRPFNPIGSADDLVSYLKSEPGYHVLQHGCHHDYLEFAGRDRKNLGDRLDRGAEQLREAGLGKSRTFVAPYDQISREAFAEASGRFDVISTGWFELSRLPGSWWPSYLVKKLRGQPHWKIGRTALLSHPGCLLSYTRSYPTMLESVRQSVRTRKLTVLVTHWWEYFREGVADEPFIAILHSLADWLGTERDIKVVPFSAVASGEISLS